ncbi:MAG: HD-GYP domain-containing protein [Phycisphaerales bacterium]
MNATHPNLLTLESRSAALRLPYAVITTAGALSAQHNLPPHLRELLASRYLSRKVVDAANAWNEQEDPQPFELIPALFALPAIRTERRRRADYPTAFHLTPEALHTEEFAAACQAASLDAQAAAASLQSWATHTGDQVARNLLLFRWLLEDAGARTTADESVAAFSTQLSEAYEELHLLYNLGRAMNEFVHPARFITHLLSELRATLPYSWFIIVFVRDAHRCPLAGQTFFTSASTDELDERRIRNAAQRFMPKINPESPSVLSLRDFLKDPAPPIEAQVLAHPVTREGRLLAAIVAGHKTAADTEVSSADIKLLAASASYLSVLLENASLYDDQQATFIGTLRALTAAIDAKDRYTRGHSDRVAHLTRLLAQASGLDQATLERVHIAGLVHDVGKIGVPESVLRKPGKLTDEEFALIKLHPEIGHNILKDIPQLEDILPGVLYHHERWDGRGYPHNLKADAIPHVARLIALADAFDAMSSTRTYRPAMPRDRVLAEIEKGAGVQFDPELARIFLTLDFAQFDHMVERDTSLEQQEKAA